MTLFSLSLSSNNTKHPFTEKEKKLCDEATTENNQN